MPNTISGAEGRTRTGTRVAPQQILSLPRLPIPPLRQKYGTRYGIRTRAPSFMDWSCQLRTVGVLMSLSCWRPTLARIRSMIPTKG